MPLIIYHIADCRIGNSLLRCHASNLLMKRAGLPAHISPAGTDFVTTLPAPITAPAPMVTPFKTMLPAPINASCSIVTFAIRLLAMSCL